MPEPRSSSGRSLETRRSPPAAPATHGMQRTQGWTLFDNQGFGQSQFDQNVTYQRASRRVDQTIQGMQGVASARVSIVLAQTARSRRGHAASAAVVLSMTGGNAPRAASSSHRQYVASPCRASRRQRGRHRRSRHVLAGAADSADSAAAQAKDLIEQQTETKIETLLDAALGRPRVCGVSAEVNSSQIQQDVTTYAAAEATAVSISQNIEQYGATASSGACGSRSTPTSPGCRHIRCMPAANTTAAPTAASTATPSATASASPLERPGSGRDADFQRGGRNRLLARTDDHQLQRFRDGAAHRHSAAWSRNCPWQCS